MNAAAWAAVIIAAVTVLSALAGLTALSYRIGRMVGKVDALILQEAADHARLGADIAVVAAAQTTHEAWHRGPGPRGPVTL